MVNRFLPCPTVCRQGCIILEAQNISKRLLANKRIKCVKYVHFFTHCPEVLILVKECIDSSWLCSTIIVGHSIEVQALYFYQNCDSCFRLENAFQILKI